MDLRINLCSEIKPSTSWPLGVANVFKFFLIFLVHGRLIDPSESSQSFRFGSQVNRPNKCLITNVITLRLPIRQKGGVLNLHV